MSTTNIITKIRALLNDNLSSGEAVFTYSTSRIFILPESNTVSVTEVSRNDTSSGVTYSYNSTNQKVTVTSSLTFGDSIKLSYTYYPDYSDTELKKYYNAAIVHLSVNGYASFEYDSTDDVFYPDVSLKDENLIALIISTLIDPDNRTIRLPDLTIQVPNDLPTNQKISKYIASFKRDTHGVFDII